ncbi:MAG: MgtC/SapB family protein [Oscillospiraceae bacterium]
MEAFELPDLYSINIFSVTLRLLLGVFLGGIIGMEREKHKRPAGFRTHILVCLGSVMAMLTNQYIFENFGGTDISRMAAQVLSGIGFLGAGTIIITGKYEVTGLTTAASLWACAAMGLAIGIGFYEGAIICCAFIFLVITLLVKLDTKLMSKERHITVRIDIGEKKILTSFIEIINKNNLKIVSINSDEEDINSVFITLSAKNPVEYKKILEMISGEPSISFSENKIV